MMNIPTNHLFRERHGRCTPEVRALWIAELAKEGITV